MITFLQTEIFTEDDGEVLYEVVREVYFDDTKQKQKTVFHFRSAKEYIKKLEIEVGYLTRQLLTEDEKE